jgi:hypothetical protein
MNMHWRRRTVTLMVIAVLAAGTHAETVYKCVGAGGQVTYQQTACPRTQKQQTLELQDTTPNAPVAPLPAAPPKETAAPPADTPQPPRAPIPRLFQCVRATDGKTYTSRNGNPEPYLAPYGILGAGGLPLSDSGQNSISAPEANRGKVGRALVASNYVWVQDQCRELSPTETCEALRADNDENEHKLRNAFQSQRAPFEQREAELARQLRGCR